VEDQKLDAVISLPSGAFKPYAGVSTAILIFTKTNSGGTDNVWFYDMKADGWSLDDKRQPLLPEEKLGVTPAETLTEAEHGKNNLPDVLSRWLRLRSAQGLATRSLSGVEMNETETSELTRARTEQSFCVPKADIVANGYDLSINRYKEVVHEVVEHRHPKDIMAKLVELENEIQAGMKELDSMLS
jgi:type I restriction enzyme M protein